MIDAPPNRAGRRYRARVLVASLVYVVTLFAEQHLLHRPLAPAARFALALLPALAIVAMFAALGRYLIEEADEYIRARTVRQVLWGTALALSALTLWGFPEDAGMLPHLPTYFAAIFWFAGFGLAAIGLKLRER